VGFPVTEPGGGQRKGTAMKIRNLLIGSLGVGLVTVAGWLGWNWFTTPVPPNISLEGVQKERADKVQQALEEVRRRPRSGKSWAELSMTLMANGFLDQAIPCLVQAEHFDPKQPRWPYFQGALLLTYGHREGFAKLHQALARARLPEERGAILFQLGQALVEDGQLDEAEQCLRELREIEGDSAGVHFGLGLLAINREDRAAARDHLSQLTDHPSARKRACALLAGLIDGDKDLAENYRRQASELPDDQPWPGSFEEDFQRYRPDPPRQFAPYYELAAAGRRQEAVEWLRQHVSESPNEGACFTLAFALFSMEEFEGSADMFRKTLQFNPGNVKAHMFLGAALLHQGEKRIQDRDGKDQALVLFRQAVASEDKAISLQGDLPHAHLTRGQALKHLGRTEESLRALREAVLVGSQLAEMHQALGEALAEAGQLPEALEHLEDAVRLAKAQDARPRQALEKWRAKAKGPQ
jgi:tetratricopeptide (TPR) repeat protein